MIAGHLLDTVGIQEMYLVISVVGFVGAGVGVFITHRGRLDASDTVP